MYSATEIIFILSYLILSYTRLHQNIKHSIFDLSHYLLIGQSWIRIKSKPPIVSLSKKLSLFAKYWLVPHLI